MHALLLASLTALAIGQISAPGASAEDADMQLTVRRLVRGLDSLRLAERDAAEASLLELGVPALDFLPPITDQTPSDVKQRLGRVRQKLEQLAAAAMGRASTVTIPDAAMRLSEVLAAIEKQTGNRLIDARARFGHKAADLELRVDFHDAPFWQALDSVLDQAGLTVYPYGEECAIYVVSRPEGQAARSGRACYVGPMRIEPVLVRAERNLRSQASPLLQLTNEIAWEPRVRPISFEQAMAAVHAQDERGKPLVLDNSGATLEIPVEGNRVAASLTYAFQAPARQVEQVAVFRGAVKGLIPGKVATFRFESLAGVRNVRQRIGGATVTLEHVRRDGEYWAVAIRVRFDEAGPALQSHRGWIFRNPAYLETANGARVDVARFETTRQTENEVGMAYLFESDAPIEGLCFVYETPALLLQLELPYEIKDIPLP
ncbi:MAG: hypothetical protein U1E05_03070 [Patescibacteria group bacterium]|nr:hypothetical protein [Patescibacteria group bacterium]